MIHQSAGVADLPPVPAGKTGWPWDNDPGPASPVRPDGLPWPRITVVTPSFNQARYLEEAIRSVLLQRYPALDYIVMDGGSTDHSRAVLMKYERWLTFWRSRPDSGQSQALNQGMSRGRGGICGWLNADDLYLPGALRTVGAAWVPECTHWLAGAVRKGKGRYTECGAVRHPGRVFSLEELLRAVVLRKPTFVQPEVFLSRDAWNTVGGLHESLHYALDQHLWVKLSAAGYTPRVLNQCLAFFRVHGAQKTRRSVRGRVRGVRERYWAVHDVLARIEKTEKLPTGCHRLQRRLLGLTALNLARRNGWPDPKTVVRGIISDGVVTLFDMMTVCHSPGGGHEGIPCAFKGAGRVAGADS